MLTAIAATHTYAHVHLYVVDAAEAARARSLIERFTAARPAEIDIVSF